MKIKSFIESRKKAHKDAELYVQSNVSLKAFQNTLKGFNWDDLYQKSGIEHLSKAFRDASDQIISELSEPIARKIIRDEIDANGVFREIDRAEQEAFHRMMVVLSKSPEEANGSWVSKSLMRSYLVKSIGSQAKYPEKVSALYRSHTLSDHESQMCERIFDRKIGERIYSFYGAKDNNAKLTSFMMDFVDKATPEEFLGVIADFAGRADKMYAHLPEQEVINYMVQAVANLVYEDAGIGVGDIARLRSEGVIKDMPLWDTKYFNTYVAPVITDEMVAEKRESFSQRFISDVFTSLKDKLSDTEIFSYMMHHGREGDISTWERGMLGFEIATGRRLTFQQARDLKPSNMFLLSKTQAYSDKVDAELDPREYRTIKIDCERDKDAERNYDGEKVVRIELTCKSLSIDSIEDSMSDEILKHEGLRSCGPTYDGYWFEFVSDARSYLTQARDIGKLLVEKLNKLNLEHILPGDAVKVSSDDAADYDLKKGSIALVTDVDIQGNIKLKGSPDFYDSDIFELRKKFQMEKSVDMSMDR